MKPAPILLLIGILLITSAFALTSIPVEAEYSSDGDSADMDNNGVADSEYGISITLVGPDGNQISVQPYKLFTFYFNTDPVTQLAITVSWEATGSDVDWATFSLSGSVTVHRTYGDTSPVIVHTEPTDSTQSTGSNSFTLQLIDLMREGTDIQSLTVHFSADASVADNYGTILTEPILDGVTVPISYAENSGSISVTGGLGYTPFSTFNSGITVAVNGFILFGAVLLIAGICLFGRR